MHMIPVTRLDKKLMYLNPDHIVCIEETPDTVITLFNGNRYIVIDRASTVISRVVAFRARVSRRAARPSGRRYLSRIRTHQSEWAVHAPDDEFYDSQAAHKNIQFHSRDY